MRDPESQMFINEFKGGSSVITLDYVPKYDREDYDFGEPKDMNRYIKDIKTMCRSSREYRKYVKFLREGLNMDTCSFYENVTNANSFKVKIHIHHDPFTIEDIIFIVVNKRRELGECTDPEMVAKEVLLLHYNLVVGLIPVSETVHELIHNHYLFVPTTKILGHYRDFVEMYKRWISMDQLRTLEMIEKYTEDAQRLEDQMTVLNKNYVYLNMDEWGLPRYDVIEKFVQDQSKGIAEGTYDFTTNAKSET